MRSGASAVVAGGHGQVELAVAGEVPGHNGKVALIAVTVHPGPGSSLRAGRSRRRCPAARSPRLCLRLAGVGDGQVEPAIAVEIAGHHRIGQDSDHQGTGARNVPSPLPGRMETEFDALVGDDQVEHAIAAEVARQRRAGVGEGRR